MQSQEIRITYLALVAFSLLGGDVYASAFTQVTSLHRPTPTADKSDGIVPQVLSIETITPKVINNDDVKNSTLMIDQQKPSKDTDIKKKLTINNDKYKNITKYQLTKKDKDDKELIADKDNYETTTLTIPITTMPSMMPTDDTVKTTIIPETTIKTMTTIVDLISSTIPSVDEASTELPIDTMMNDSSTFIIPTLSVHQNNSQTTNEDVYSPLLLDGEPIVDLTTTTTTSTTELPPTSQVAMEDETMSRARALNISASEPTNSLQANITDLSDVSMDNDENKEPEGVEYVVKHNETTTTTTTTVLPITLLPPIICHDGNKTYNPGERIIHGCDEKCICGDDGIITRCEPICMSPYVRAGRGENTDPFCHEAIVGTDGCCAVLECSDSATEAEETCVFENKTINRGQRVEDGCSRVCICETGGTLKCQPRCPPNETATGMKQHDRCVALPDPRDSCCTITLCDVSLGEHEIKSENISDLTVNLTDVKVINSTAIKLKLSSELSSDAVIEVSEDNRIWMQRKIDNNGILSNLEPAHSYHVRITEGGRTGPSLRVILPAEVIKTNITDYKFDKNTCNHRGKLYKIGDEWYDECISFCVCNNSAKIECATIQCPTEFGLDVLDPTCLDWEPVPSDFTAKAPDCCPKEMRCRNNGSCEYEGSTYENWSTIPKNKTGCETTCSCEFGKINCTPTCPTVTALPPSTLNCPAYQAVLVSLPHHECCKEWMCDRTIHKTNGNRDNFPPGFPNQVIGQSPSDEVVIKELEALVPRNVRVVFTVPAVLIGLQARFELRYTSNQTNTDPSTWNSQLYLPPDELISTQKMEVELDNLEIATIYKVKVIVNVRDLTNHPSSQIYTVKTYEPPEILIDAELQVEQTNSSLIQMIWRKFSDNETRFIDGVQLRYRLLNASTFVRTPLIHRAITSYVIENLAPSTTYEIGISIIPFPGQKTELKTPKTILVTTTIETNPWAFEIDFDIKTVKSQEVEISWSGIPYPEDRYVNIYRAICKSDRGTEDTSTFKIAKRDSPAKTIISGLKPATRYSLWLMVYLKNGKTLQSNVKDFVTKPGTILSAGIGAQGKLASVQIHDGDYYGPLVIVAIVASLSILSTLILLMMLMKRRSSSKADISPRKTTSAYDNPSYKVEIQQETMDL